MRFDGYLQRAKEQGLKICLFQLNPRPKMFTTVSDKEFSKVVGAALAFAAVQFTKKPGETRTKDQMLVEMFQSLRVQADIHLPLVSEVVTEEDMMSKHVEGVLAKSISDEKLDQLFEEYEEEEKKVEEKKK